jgi:hypothetical protein
VLKASRGIDVNLGKLGTTDDLNRVALVVGRGGVLGEVGDAMSYDVQVRDAVDFAKVVQSRRGQPEMGVDQEGNGAAVGREETGLLDQWVVTAHLNA